MTTNYKIYNGPLGWIDDTIFIELSDKQCLIVTSYSISRKGENTSPTITYTPPNIEETLIYAADENMNLLEHRPIKAYPRKISLIKAFEQYLKEII